MVLKLDGQIISQIRLFGLLVEYWLFSEILWQLLELSKALVTTFLVMLVFWVTSNFAFHLSEFLLV